MSADKVLNFKMVVDQASVQQLQNVVKGMVRDFDALTKSIQNASAAMGGLMGGGVAGAPKGPGATVGGGSYHAGPAVQPNAPGGAKQGNVADNLRQQADSFRQTAQAAAQSMTAMTKSIGDAARQAGPQIAALTAQVRALGGAMAGVRGMAGGNQLALPSGDAGGGQPGEKFMGWAQRAGGPPSGGGGGFGPPVVPGGGSGGGMMAGAMGAMGMASLVAGIGMAVAGAVMKGVEFSKSARMLNVDMASERGNAVSGNFSAGLGGDFAWLQARKFADRDADFRATKAKIGANTWQNRIGMAPLAARAKEAFNSIGDRWEAAKAFRNGDPNAIGTINAINEREAGVGQTVEETERIKGLQDAQAKRNQEINAVENAHYYGKYQASMGERAMFERRYGGSIVRDKNDATTIIQDRYLRMRAQAEAAGLGLGEVTGMHSQLAQSMGERAGGRNAVGVIQNQQAGWQGTDRLLAVGEQGGSMAFAHHVMGLGGSAFDPHAAIQLGNGLNDRMRAAGEGIYDQSGMLAMAKASGMFNGGAGDILASQRFLGGIDAANKGFQGGIDQWGKTQNVMAAMKVVGNGNPQAVDYLAGMSVERMVAIAGGAALFPDEVARGITPTMVKKVLDEKNSQSGFRYYGKSGGIEDLAAEALRKGPEAMKAFVKKHGTTAAKGALTAVLMDTQHLDRDKAIGLTNHTLGIANRSFNNQKGLKSRAGAGDRLSTGTKAAVAKAAALTLREEEYEKRKSGGKTELDRMIDTDLEAPGAVNVEKETAGKDGVALLSDMSKYMQAVNTQLAILAPLLKRINDGRGGNTNSAAHK